MKNKKILSRVLAFSATLLLIVALALPCFADEPNNTTRSVYVTVMEEFTDRASLYNFLTNHFGDLVSVRFTMDGLVMDFNSFVYIPNDDTYRFSTIMPIYDVYNSDGFLNVYSVDITSVGSVLGNWTYGFDVYPVDVSDEQWSLFGITAGVIYRTELVLEDSATPIRTGMFGQLYSILRDAIFGKDVVLDSNQDFVLTQISTWMTYIVILLPILVVGLIVFKLFR